MQEMPKRRQTRKATYVPEVPIQHLDIAMNNLQCDQFIVILLNSTHEKERCIAAIDDLRVLVLEKVAHAGPARKDKLCHVLDNLGLTLRAHRLEPFAQPDFALPADQEHPIEAHCY